MNGKTVTGYFQIGNGSLTINDSEGSGSLTGYINQLGGELTINGGTFGALMTYACSTADAHTPTTLSVLHLNGGTFRGLDLLDNSNSYGILCLSTENNVQTFLAGAPSEGKLLSKEIKDGSAIESYYTAYCPGPVSVINKADFSVSGDVKDSTSNPADGVIVKLMKGNTLVAKTKTDSSGQYTFHAPAGVYNIVAEKGGVTMTVLVTVTENTTVDTITMPDGKTSSVLNVIPGTPDVVVGNINQIFADGTLYTSEDSTTVTGGGSVEFKVTVEKKDDAAIVDDVTKIAATKSADATIGLYLDMSVKKTVTPNGGAATESPVTEMNVLLENIVPLPEALRGKAGYTVYRVHNGRAEALPSSGSGERFEVNNGKTEITIYAKKFSTYAIGYTETVTPPTPSVPTAGGGSVSYTITGADTENGALTISHRIASAGTAVTITAAPDEGYQLEKLTVIGKNGKEIALTERDGKYTFTMPAFNGVLLFYC